MKLRVAYAPYGDGRKYFADDVEITALAYRRLSKQVNRLDLTAPPATASLTGWPILSDAAGVAPDQVGEAMAHSRLHGVPTEFTPDGRVIFRGPLHRKEYCELIGLFDRNGSYGDPQRRKAG